MVAQRATQRAAAHSGATDDITGSSARWRNGRHHRQQYTAVQGATPWAAAVTGTRERAWLHLLDQGKFWELAHLFEIVLMFCHCCLMIL